MNWWKLGTNSPRCVLGEINVVRYPREGLGCVTSLSMVDFSDFIENLNLVDLPLEGGLYTWCSGMDPPSVLHVCWFWQIGRNISLMCCKNFYRGHFLIIVRFWWKLVVWHGGRVLSSLKTYGERQKDSWIRFVGGGLDIPSGASPVLF